MAKHSTRPSNAPPRVAPDVASMRQDQRERRDRIVRAAVRLMVDVDYHKIQVREVADQAGVALGTLYRYFTSKDHLFACALVEWASGFGDRIEEGSPASTLDRVKKVYRLAARAFEREPRVFDVIIQLSGSKEPDTTATFTAFSRSTTEAFASALGDIPPPDRDDIAFVMSSVLTESLRSWQHGIMTLPEVYRRIARAAELILS